MDNLSQELDAFADYARGRLAAGQAESLDELFDDWRTSQAAEDDRKAIAASIRDMEQGEIGRPLGEFGEEFRRHNGLDG